MRGVPTDGGRRCEPLGAFWFVLRPIRGSRGPCPLLFRFGGVQGSCGVSTMLSHLHRDCRGSLPIKSKGWQAVGGDEDIVYNENIVNIEQHPQRPTAIQAVSVAIGVEPKVAVLKD